MYRQLGVAGAIWCAGVGNRCSPSALHNHAVATTAAQPRLPEHTCKPQSAYGLGSPTVLVAASRR